MAAVDSTHKKDDEYITLQDILENFEGSYLKLGFKNGSGFVWCDKINKYTFDILNNISISEYEDLKSEYKRLEYTIQHTLDTSEKTQLEKQLKKLNKRIDKFKLYTERQVVDFYKSDNPLEDDEVYNNCYIAIIDGNKKCLYWTVKEYQKRWDKC